MFVLPNLPYDYSALEPFIDTETMKFHYNKHHAAYVKNLNDLLIGHEELSALSIEDLLKNINQVPESIRQKVINNAGQCANHNFFWEIMSAKHDQKPQGDLLNAINRDFGSFENFQSEFEKKGLARFGSGWIWLIQKNSKLEIIDTVNGDSPLMQGFAPILGVDVWEHAYYLKYKNVRGDYLNAWWHVVNWSRAEEIFKQIS